jgi:hypothetical protein
LGDSPDRISVPAKLSGACQQRFSPFPYGFTLNFVAFYFVIFCASTKKLICFHGCIVGVRIHSNPTSQNPSIAPYDSFPCARSYLDDWPVITVIRNDAQLEASGGQIHRFRFVDGNLCSDYYK